MTRSRVFALLGPVFLGLAAMLTLGALLSLVVVSTSDAAGSGQPLWVVPVAFAGVALPFGLVGGVFFLLTRWTRKRQSELMASGEKVSARVVALERSMLRINHKRAHILVCTAQSATRGALTLRSEPLLAQPADWLGRELTAYVDRADPRRYALILEGNAP